MPFMLKIQWDIKAGREADFRDIKQRCARWCSSIRE
jgi:hypothetical protein